MAEGKLAAGERWLFALGDFFGGGAQSVLSVLYLVFLTNVLGIEPGWAGTVVLVSKVWDAVNDPLMGMITDNTRTKMGRRRPYLLAGGILIFVATALIWLPVGFESQAAKTIFVTAAYLFYYTVSTIIAVPYSSMSTEITGDFDECNRVNVLRLMVSLCATALCTLIPSELFRAYSNGGISLGTFYLIMVFGFGTAFAVPLILIGLFGRERVPYGEQKTKFSLSGFARPFRVRAFRKLTVLYLAQAVTLDMVSAVVIYYSLYVVAGMSTMVFLGAFLGIQLVMYAVINRLLGRVSKTKIYRAGIPLAVAGSFCIAFYPAGFPLWGLYALTAVTALGFGGAQVMNWIMFPDVVDIGELGLGERITGAFSGVMTFIRTASTAIAIFLLGQVLSATGFTAPTDAVPQPAQTGATVLGIRLFMFVPFALFMSTAWAVARKFRLTPEVSRRVKYFIEKQRAGQAETLSAEERAEREALMKEFV